MREKIHCVVPILIKGTFGIRKCFRTGSLKSNSNERNVDPRVIQKETLLSPVEACAQELERTGRPVEESSVMSTGYCK